MNDFNKNKMLKVIKFIFFLFLCILLFPLSTYSFDIDKEIKSIMENNSLADTVKIDKILNIAYIIQDSLPEMTIKVAEIAYSYANKINHLQLKWHSKVIMSYGYYNLGKYKEALDILLEAYKYRNYWFFNVNVYNYIGETYHQLGRYDKSIEFYQKMLIHSNNQFERAQTFYNLGNLYLKLKDTLTAYFYHKKSLSIREGLEKSAVWGQSYVFKDLALSKFRLGVIFEMLNKIDSSLIFLKSSFIYACTSDEVIARKYIMYISYWLGKLYQNKNQEDSALKYFKIAYSKAIIYQNKELIKLVSNRLSNLLYQESHKFYNIFFPLKDSTFMDPYIKLEEKQIINEIDKTTYEIYCLNQAKKNLKLAVLLICIFALMLTALLFQTIRLRKQRENSIREKQKYELEEKERQLASYITLINSKNETLKTIADEIIQLKREHQSPDTTACANRILSKIRTNNNVERDWKRFLKHFEAVHSDFFTHLNSLGKNLTQNEIRLCAYLKMNLSNKDISNMLNVNLNTIIVAKKRLKKKLGTEDDLNNFIQNL